jgi:alpha-tubulin suppressor-like RCC1 family protein
MGQLHPKPVDAFDGKVIKQLACAEYETLALSKTGDVWKWNWGSPSSVSVMESKRIVDIQSGQDFFAALSSTGKLYTWGSSTYPHF